AFRARHSGAALLVADRGAEPEIEAMDDRPAVVFTDDAELAEESRETADTAAGNTAFILYTSGTTKDPKGVVHTHAYTYAKRAQAERWLDARGDDLVWCTAATGWAKSVWNVLLGPWSVGASIVLHEGALDPEERFRLPAGRRGRHRAPRPAAEPVRRLLRGAGRDGGGLPRRALRHGRPSDPRRRRLPLVHRPLRRRHPLRRLPDRPLRGRERAARARGGCRERRRRQAAPRPRPDREGVRRAA